MIASSFKSVGWVAGVGAAALGCYMLSLQVAAERAELARVEGRIVAARQAIRNLQTELGTRGRLQQLEHWNAEVLALSAPVAGQFVANEAVLARLETREPGLDRGAEVQMASAETAANQAAPPARPAVAAAPAEAARPAPQPVVRRASLAAAEAPARPAPIRAALPAPRPQPRAAAPVRTASLLDERTTRELGEAARAERAGRGSDAAPRRAGAERPSRPARADAAKED